MLLINSILVPIDFSPCSINALQYAAEIARKLDATLRLLHIENSNQGTVVNGIDTNAMSALKELGKATYLKKMTVYYSISQGAVSREVLTAQAKFNCDLIVMGTLGANKLNRKLFGTNTAKIILDARCAVWAVPEGITFNGIGTFAFATDLSDSGIEIANEFCSIAKKFESEIKFIHVDVQNKYKHETGYKTDNTLQHIKTLVDYNKISLHISNYNKITDGLDSFVRKNKPEVLVMINHKRNLLQSLYETSQTREMVHYSNTPLLALPYI